MKNLILTLFLFSLSSFSNSTDAPVITNGIDHAYSFITHKLKPVDFSKDVHAIVIQEHCGACKSVYRYIDKMKKKSSSNVILTSTVEPGKRWKKIHQKYTKMYQLYSIGNIIREKGAYPRATPALYSWDAKKKKGTFTYGLDSIVKVLSPTP